MKKLISILALVSLPVMADEFPISAGEMPYTTVWPTYGVNIAGPRTYSGVVTTFSPGDSLTGPDERAGLIAGNAFAYAIQKFPAKFNPYNVGGDMFMVFENPVQNLRIRTVATSSSQAVGLQYSADGVKWYTVPRTSMQPTGQTCYLYKTATKAYPDTCWIFEVVVPGVAGNIVHVRKLKDEEGHFNILKVSSTLDAPGYVPAPATGSCTSNMRKAGIC